MCIRDRQWLVRETDITYLRPLVYGDTVIVKTWVGDFRRVRSRRDYALRLAGSGEPVATASSAVSYTHLPHSCGAGREDGP